MGCSPSVHPHYTTEAKVVKDTSNSSTTKTNKSKQIKNECYTQIINEKCPRIRLDQSEEPQPIPISGENFDLNIRVSYVSQRGYYPNEVGKANQDSYVICHNILNDKSFHLFGIFDGHGEFGDYCSYFTADRFPALLAEGLKRNEGVKSITNSKANSIITRAFLDTNFALHSSSIDDSLSGTTGISIILKGDKLIVANVGDSRAIIASENDAGKLIYSPLSNDQTPYRKDERERVKKAGGHIMTYEQIDGNEPIHENWGTSLGEEIDEVGDPPRVWDDTLEKPGCAFTRSIGDAVGKGCGISAEPEILVWEITENDKFAIVASDGVFEFITSQGVVDMVAKYASPVEAAKHVVAEAYRLWLTYDDRTDDITMIIINFDDIREKISTDMKESDNHNHTRIGSLSKAASMRNVNVITSKNIRNTNKPVRKVMSRAKRKDISDNFVHDEKATFDFANIVNTKTQDELMKISKMLSTNFLFENLSPVQKDNIYKVMTMKEVQPNEVIIKEGEQGDAMYIVDSGEFSVYKKDEKGQDQLLFVYTTEGSAFGELSLMYGKPRAASIVAKTKGKLWSIGRTAFRAVIMKGRLEGLLQIYKTIPILAELSYPQLHRLCMASIEENYDKGEVVIDEEKAAKASCWALCVVMSGTIRCLTKEESKKRQIRSDMSYLLAAEVGTKFREVKADIRTRLTCIPKDIFMDIVNPDPEMELLLETPRKSGKGKRLQSLPSVFGLDNSQRLETIVDLDMITLEHPAVLIGDYAYIGNFKLPNDTNECRSLKVIAKQRAHKARMDAFLLQERQYLATLSSLIAVNRAVNDVRRSEKNADESAIDRNMNCIAEIIATTQDEKFAYLEYKEQFVCDLSLALSNNAIPEESKPLYLACIYSAISAVHMNGLLHRFINSNSFYITSSGIPKLADFRYAKLMDGSKSYTICGDALYFAPEIVSQMGYDYSADLWAFGILMFEFYEGHNPFGNDETEETLLFKAISGYHFNRIKFSSANQVVKTMIRRILDPKGKNRLGYKSSEDVRRTDYFAGIPWLALGSADGYPLDIQQSIDPQPLFSAASSDIKNYKSELFDHF